jgi:hypothetical protein
MAINICILAASRDKNADQDSFPLCLEDVKGSSVLEAIVSSTSVLPDSRYSYAFLKDDVKRFHLDKIANLLTPGCNSIEIPEASKGSGCSALYSTCHLDQESELLIVSANELVQVDFSEIIDFFLKNSCSAGTIVFSSVHPRYSYVRLDDAGFVIEASQKKPISKHATAGVFWFKKTKYFTDAAKKQIEKNADINGNFYVAPAFNELILDGKVVGAFSISNSQYTPLKDMDQLNRLN